MEAVPIVGTWKSLPFTKHEFHHFVTPLSSTGTPSTPVSSVPTPSPTNDLDPTHNNSNTHAKRFETIDTPSTGAGGSNDSEQGEQSSTEEVVRASSNSGHHGSISAMSPGASLSYPQSPWDGAPQPSTWHVPHPHHHHHLTMNVGLGQPILMGMSTGFQGVMMVPPTPHTPGMGGDVSGAGTYDVSNLSPGFPTPEMFHHASSAVAHSPSTMYPL